MKRREEMAGNNGGIQHAEPGEDGKEKKEAKSFGRMFVESDAYKRRVKNGIGPDSSIDIELKTLMSRSAGFAPESLRNGRIVDAATRPLQVIDILPMLPTSYDHVKYMEETIFTNNAAEAAEGGAYQEAALAYEEKSEPVQKIAVFIPVTDEQLEDVSFIESRIDMKLRFMLMQRLDYQCINGSGSSPNLRGILNKPSIQTQAKAGDPGPDDIRLLRTADGIYIWGSPSEAGPERIWGAPVAQADSLTEGTSVLGDFANFSYLASKRGIDMQVGFINDDFKLGRRSIRADLRTVLIWERATAFCTVTGM
jgi:hypothetical protein